MYYLVRKSVTVGGAFNRFREEVVDLDPDDTARAKSSRNYLFTQLKGLSDKYDNFPLVFDYLKFGSFARRTKIQPLDDVDILLLLNGNGTTSTVSPASLNSPYLYWLKIKDPDAPLAKFPDGFGYVNSNKILNRIRDTLPLIYNYKSADIHRNGCAVTFKLASYSWVFDIVPAIPVTDGIGGTDYYLIPNGNGDWIRTDPRIDAKNVTEVNIWHQQKFIPTVRLLKYWNTLKCKPVLPSYYFETLILRVFRYAPKFNSFQEAVDYFFRNCPGYLLMSCPDPKNLGPSLDGGIDPYIKQKVRQAMIRESQSSGKALVYEKLNNNQQAIYYWREVFGSEFPTYGY